MKNHTLKSIFLILLCGLCWGPSFLLIKIALPSFPPLTIAFGRAFIAFLVLLPVCFLQKQNLLAWRHQWKFFFAIGITFNALPSYLIAYGEVYIPSALAGILNGLTAIFTLLLAHFFAKEHLTVKKITGIILGIIGLGFIYLPMILHSKIDHMIGAFLVVLACLSYGIGSVYARSKLTRAPKLVILTYQLLAASILLLPFSLTSFTMIPTLQASLALLGLGVIGTALGFYVYFKAIETAGATYASLSTFIVPILAILLGLIFLHEEISWNFYIGCGFILGSLASVNPILNRA